MAVPLFLLVAGCGLFVVPNGSTPALEVLSPLPGSTWGELESIPFEARIGDGDDPLSQVSLLITSDRDGEICHRVPGVTGLVDCSAVLSAGEHVLTFDATDTGGRSDRVELLLTVLGLQDTGEPDDTGNTGDTGDTGGSGDTGDTGNTGDTGDTGGSGDTGDTGDTDALLDTGVIVDTARPKAPPGWHPPLYALAGWLERVLLHFAAN